MRPSLLLATALCAALPAITHAAPGGQAPVAAPAAYQPRLLTAAEASADVALMRRALETIHPGLYRYSSKAVIDAAFARLEAAAARPITDLALHAQIALMLATIHCDHTKAELSDPITAYRQTSPTHLPFRFRLIEGRMIVLSNDGQPGAPPAGAEILRINAMPVPILLNRLAPMVSYDGDTDQAVAAKLGDDSDLSGDDFNENYPSLFGFPASWRIDWKMPGAANATTATLAPISFDRWVRLDSPDGAYHDEFYKSITWRMAGKVARLRIDTLVNYRNPVQTTAFLGGFFKAMKAAGTEHLILDLRHNGGGSEDVSIALGRYLFDAPFIWSKPVRYKAIRYGDLPHYIATWGDTDALFNAPEAAFDRTTDGWYERKVDTSAPESDDDNSTIAHLPIAADHFGGRLTVLTGPRNGSGATRTIAQLKERRGAVLVGEDAAGSAEGPTAGQIFLTTLPNSGLKLRIPNAWNRTNITRFVPRRGVAVDVLVTPTLADFEAGRDRALAVARNPQPPLAAADALAGLFDGHWAGTLDYRDYGNDGRVVLPTQLDGKGGTLTWTYEDGPGKTVRSTERWAVTDGGTALSITRRDGTQRYAVSECRKLDDDSLTIVLDGSGTENGAKVIKRLILTAQDKQLRLTEMSRTPGAPFLMRHSYRLRRD